MGPVAWRPSFPEALRGEETVNPTRPIGSGISVNRLRRDTKASLLTRLGMVKKPLAQIYAWTGEFDEAFRLLDHLLVIPSSLTVPMLKLDPAWDPLRKDPRLQALIDKYSPRT